MSLKKRFHQNDWFFESKFENNLTRRSKRKKMKINLILTDSHHRRNVQRQQFRFINHQKLNIENRKLKIAVWDLTTVCQQFRSRIRIAKNENYNHCSVDRERTWKLKITSKTIETMIAKILSRTCKRRLINYNDLLDFIKTLKRKNTN